MRRSTENKCTRVALSSFDRAQFAVSKTGDNPVCRRISFVGANLNISNFKGFISITTKKGRCNFLFAGAVKSIVKMCCK